MRWSFCEIALLLRSVRTSERALGTVWKYFSCLKQSGPKRNHFAFLNSFFLYCAFMLCFSPVRENSPLQKLSRCSYEGAVSKIHSPVTPIRSLFAFFAHVSPVVRFSCQCLVQKLPVPNTQCYSQGQLGVPSLTSPTPDQLNFCA